jgi:hypothetical protein
MLPVRHLRMCVLCVEGAGLTLWHALCVAAPYAAAHIPHHVFTNTFRTLL